MHILFLVPYPQGQAPSQRFRFEQYLTFLQNKGITYDFSSFLDTKTWHLLYKPGYTFQKSFGILKGFLRRIRLIFLLFRYDYVFIHREATPIGPPVIEWLIGKVFRKKIIYDFDDAIWLPNTSASNRIAAQLKWHQKVKNICRWSYKVSCGNQYLCDFAQQFNTHVTLNPTTIDTTGQHNRLKNQQTEKFVIGWTGTHSTLPYLKPLFPVLEKLYRSHDFLLQVIANAPPDEQVKFIQFIPWQKDTEIDDLLAFNVGLMPLTDDLWAKGKCGFKALQYMALGIPALVSPVGVNSEIVEDGVNGFICTNEKDWYNALEKLITDTELREKMGIAGRKTVEEKYSVISNTNNFLQLFS
jgi:glycosyltransferase involved in cell wall biosynthesis